MLKSKNQRIKELQEENRQLRETITKLMTPIEGTPKGRQCEVVTVDDSLPPTKEKENVISNADFFNL